VAASRAVIRSRLQTAVDILNQARLRSRPMYRSLRPRYPEEFRREALELVRTSGRSIADVARSLGITDSTLHIWLKAERDAKRRAEDPERVERVRTRGAGSAAQGEHRVAHRPRDPAQGLVCDLDHPVECSAALVTAGQSAESDFGGPGEISSDTGQLPSRSTQTISAETRGRPFIRRLVRDRGPAVAHVAAAAAWFARRDRATQMDGVLELAGSFLRNDTTAWRVHCRRNAGEVGPVPGTTAYLHPGEY